MKKTYMAVLIIAAVSIIGVFAYVQYAHSLNSIFPSTQPLSNESDTTTSTNMGTTTTSSESTSHSLVVSGNAVMGENISIPNSLKKELTSGRYKIIYESDSDTKLIVYRNGRFKATCGSVVKSCSLLIDVNMGEEGEYEFVFEGGLGEASVAITQLLKFEKEV